MTKWIAAAALAVPMVLAGCSHPQPVYYAPPPPPAYSQAAQQGYREGFNAGARDAQRGGQRPINAHARFRNPNVPPPLWPEFRQGFENGYAAAFAPPR